MHDLDPRLRMQLDAHERLSRCLQSSIEGRWHEIVLVLSRRHSAGGLRRSVFGCSAEVRVLDCDEIDAAAVPLFSVTGAAGEVFHLPLYVHRNVGRSGSNLNMYAATQVFDGDYDWETILRNLEDSAAIRAQEGTGPAEYSLEQCVALLASPGVGCPGDDLDGSAQVRDAVAVVLGQARRHCSRLLDAGVVLIRASEAHARGVAMVTGDFLARGKHRRICQTGDSSAAATYLMAIGANPAHAPRTTFIPFVRRNGETVWAMTRDPVIALRHMDATERLRLRSFGLLP